MFKLNIVLLVVLSILTSCNSNVSSPKKISDKDSVYIPPKKNTTNPNSFEFTKRIIDTNRKFNTLFSTSIIPSGFKNLTDKRELKFDINFYKDYFNLKKKLEPKLLTSDSFYHIIIREYFENIEAVDFNTDLILDNTLNKAKFIFSIKNIKNYGLCNIGIINSGTCNAQQDKTMILINNQKQEFSIWSYDEFKFDKQGNISSLFRLKDRRTWYYYNYDTASNCFIPVATKYWKLYDN